MTNQRPFTLDELAFLKSHASGNSFRELTELFNEYFCASRSIDSIKSFCGKHGVRNGIDRRYSKDRKSPYTYSSDSAFSYAIGIERVDVYGFVKVKTAMPDVWEFKHHLVWKEYFGEIPKHSVVLFADGNNRNFAPENLIMLSRNEFSWLIGKKLRPGNAGLAKSAALLAKLAIKTRAMCEEVKKGWPQNRIRGR